MSDLTHNQKTGMEETNNWWRDFGACQKVLTTLSENVGKELIIFDTETTGLSPTENHIIQISAIKCMIDENCQFHETDRFDTYINPEYPLQKKIIQLTGITDSKLEHYPTEKEQWNTIYRFFGDGAIVCGYNVPFDINMLNAMYMRESGTVFQPIALDVMRMAQELHLKKEIERFKLGVLASHFGLDDGLTFHNSFDDVIATMRLLRFFIDEYQEKLENAKPIEKIKTKVKCCWAWTGYRGMQRLYVRVAKDNRLLYMNQRRPYDWGEKDKGSIEMFNMEDVEAQVLKLYKCNTLEELSKVRDTRYVY